MGPVGILIIVVVAAVLWFGVLRPKLGPGRDGDGGSAAFMDGGTGSHGRGGAHDRSHDHGHPAGHDADGSDGGGDGGGGDGGGD